jgi:hypothetical protein
MIRFKGARNKMQGGKKQDSREQETRYKQQGSEYLWSISEVLKEEIWRRSGINHVYVKYS